MRWLRPLLSTTMAVMAFIPLSASESAQEYTTIKPIVDEFCLSCHSTQKQKGDFDLEAHTGPNGLRNHPKVWQQVLSQMLDGEMPPKEKPQPTAAQRQQLLTWIRTSLDAVARERAGDPGPVVLRRLSNAEYTYTVRDLTGIAALDPTKEFPVDGAAGEGFTNTGMALVMSPSLVTKFMDAGKDIARHALLVPEGLRWTAGTSRRDGTDDILREIREFYARYTVPGEAGTVNLQGITLDRSHGAKMPLERYLAAALEVRGGSELAAVASARRLSTKYLHSVVDYLDGSEDADAGLRGRWRMATAQEIPAITAELERWQKALWKFNKVGDVGWPKGPARWMEPMSPLTTRHEVKLKLPGKNDGSDQVISLVAEDAGGAMKPAIVVWQEPTLTIAGRPPMPLSEVGGFIEGLVSRRDRMVAAIPKALAAAAEAKAATTTIDSATLAARYNLDQGILDAWLTYLGITANGTPELTYLKEKFDFAGDRTVIKGWRTDDLPSLVTNSSDTEVRIPGRLKPHGVAVHPTPHTAVAVGWRSPVNGTVRVGGLVADAHHDCGNGVTWVLERRSGTYRQRLAGGIAERGEVGRFTELVVPVRTGDLLSIVIGPRGADHTCDLTELELEIAIDGGGARSWSLSKELSSDPHAGNPHADGAGTPDVWHIYSEPATAADPPTAIPASSVLARWMASDQVEELPALAQQVQRLASGAAPKDGPDATLHRQLTSLTSPLMSASAATKSPSESMTWGTATTRFGSHPTGGVIGADDLAVSAPSVISCRLPAELAVHAELVTHVTLSGGSDANAVRARVVAGTPPAPPRRDWWSGDVSVPLLTQPEGTAHRRIATVIADLQRLFPASLCYTRIVPVDEVVTLTLFFREDHELQRLILTEAENAQLERLWQHLHFISQDALTQVDAFEQIWQYTTQGGDPAPLEPLRTPIMNRAAEFRKFQIACEPRQLAAVIDFAGQAYRRPLTEAERSGFHELYQSLRQQEIAHEDAIRLLLARVLVSPGFLYKSERPAPGKIQQPVSDVELATRLSYFLWSSQPDAELRSLAATGRLHEPAVLKEQVRRMLADVRARRLAVEFGLAWLHLHDFATLDEKSEKHFPTFLGIRADLNEEAVLMLSTLFQRDGSLLDLLVCDHTWLNENLAKHYGIPGISGPEMRRVDGVAKYHRGGILGLGATMARQAGASRTSPILRGNWVSEVLLGEKLPRPPKGVPQLPEDEAAETLTVRQITERHSADPRCSSCHARIDPFGYSLENYDAIGRWREQDLAGRPLDTVAKLAGGAELRGVDGLRAYLLNTRRDAFVRQFSRKLLGFALGRGVQLSDEPLIAEIQAKLAANHWRVTIAIDSIVQSRQFREIRGRDAAFEE